MPATRQVRRITWGLATGLVATVVVALLYGSGAFVLWELDALDLWFRYCSQLGPSEQILHIDINDDALERIHRWPWPRRYHAQLIDALHALGARSIVMDIVFAERQPPRTLMPHADTPEELDTRLAGMGEIDRVFDDAELAAAVAKAGNVYLAMYFDPASASSRERERVERIRALAAEQPDRPTDELIAEALERDNESPEGLSPAQWRAGRRTHLGLVLESDFAAKATTLAQRTDLDEKKIGQILAGLKRDVAQRLVRLELDREPELPCEEVIERILPSSPRDPLDVRDIEAAYATETAIRASIAEAPPVPAASERRFPAARALTPPIASLARAAKGCGFVTFEADSPDGVLREIPLVARFRGRVIRQLAFEVLCDTLAVEASDIQGMGASRLLLKGARWPDSSEDVDLAIPLDEQGRFLLNWYAGPDGRWHTAFDHLAVGRVLEIPLNREAADRAERHARAEAVRFTTARGAKAAYDAYVQLARSRDRRSNRLRTLAPGDPRRRELAHELKEIRRRTEEIEERAVGTVREYARQIRGLKPESEEERREFETIARIARELERAERLRAQAAQRFEELRPVVSDKVCFVGYTATAVADFVGTPVFDRAPGVVAHANLFHTLYQQAIVRRAPGWVAYALIFVCGLGVTGSITAWRGPIFSLLTTAIGLSALVVAAAVGVFYVLQVWVVVVAVVAAILSSWGLITAYRQLTEGREKRQALNRLGQYTSPSLARRLAEEPNVLERAESREVTCFFSDLKGFTSLSEHLGPERTQALLNVYLERMSEVLDRHEAFINKFLGDGIFAFFNPAVNPQPDHARRACEAALDSQQALRELIAEQTEESDPSIARLEMRVGLATGSVVVGNCGSARKFDYTCIGDTVNLAARLESANKAFGTSIMVAESTRAASGDRYEWRHLGGLRVVGKQQRIDVFEFLGRAGDVDDAVKKYARRFEEGVRLFQQGRWVDCTTHFTRMLARRPDDLGLMLYVDLCQQYQRFGPPEDWAGETPLTEK